MMPSLLQGSQSPSPQAHVLAGAGRGSCASGLSLTALRPHLLPPSPMGAGGSNVQIHTRLWGLVQSHMQRLGLEPGVGRHGGPDTVSRHALPARPLSRAGQPAFRTTLAPAESHIQAV